jgi:DNA polymerase-3 subunit delta
VIPGRGAVARALTKPDPDLPGALLYGADAMRVAIRRKELIDALTGPGAEEEMRLTRMTGAEAKTDPASVLDAVKAVGFFPGPRVVLVDGVTEAQASPVLEALTARAQGDASLVVTAGALRKGAKLRTAFETHPKALAVGIYDDPMGRDELDGLVAAEGVSLDESGRAALEALAVEMGPGALRQLVATLATYAGGERIGAEAVEALAPATLETAADAVIAAAAEGRAAQIGPLMTRLAGQGVTPVSLVIAATRHFQQLHQAATGGGVGALRPPVYGPRRDAMERQTRAWGARRLEEALALLMETDLTLRSAARAPAMAVMERALIKLAMTPRG